MALDQLRDRSMRRLKEALKASDGTNDPGVNTTESLSLKALLEKLSDVSNCYMKQLADPALRQCHPRIHNLQACHALISVEGKLRLVCQEIDDFFFAQQVAYEEERRLAEAERHKAAERATQHLRLRRLEPQRQARDMERHQATHMETLPDVNEPTCSICKEVLYGACE